jgi:chromosome segregation ATPase
MSVTQRKLSGKRRTPPGKGSPAEAGPVEERIALREKRIQEGIAALEAHIKRLEDELQNRDREAGKQESHVKQLEQKIAELEAKLGGGVQTKRRTRSARTTGGSKQTGKSLVSEGRRTQRTPAKRDKGPSK